jgi:hypothetical protein
MKRTNIIDMRRTKDSMGNTKFIPVRNTIHPENNLVQLDKSHPAGNIVKTVSSTATNEAKAFLIKTSVVSVIFAITAAIASVVVFQHPFLSIITVFITSIAALVVWAGAYAMNEALSPIGLAFYNTKRHWDVIEYEQEFRHYLIQQDKYYAEE